MCDQQMNKTQVCNRINESVFNIGEDFALDKSYVK